MRIYTIYTYTRYTWTSKARPSQRKHSRKRYQPKCNWGPRAADIVVIIRCRRRLSWNLSTCRRIIIPRHLWKFIFYFWRRASGFFYVFIDPYRKVNQIKQACDVRKRVIIEELIRLRWMRRVQVDPAGTRWLEKLVHFFSFPSPFLRFYAPWHHLDCKLILCGWCEGSAAVWL